MFNVCHRYNHRIYTVYSVKPGKAEFYTEFLIYDDVYGHWLWESADQFVPVI